jgi:hypothetical protein
VDRYQVEPPAEQVEKLTLRVQKAVQIRGFYGPQTPADGHIIGVAESPFLIHFSETFWNSSNMCFFLVQEMDMNRSRLFFSVPYFGISKIFQGCNWDPDMIQLHLIS